MLQHAHIDELVILDGFAYRRKPYHGRANILVKVGAVTGQDESGNPIIAPIAANKKNPLKQAKASAGGKK